MMNERFAPRLKVDNDQEIDQRRLQSESGAQSMNEECIVAT